MTTRQIDIHKSVLDKNDLIAACLRERFHNAGLLALNVLSSPGSGKTALLERVMHLLRSSGHPVAALVGDLQTDNDAKRLARSGAPVRQIVTDGICHLDAAMIATHLADWKLDLQAQEFFFIENVGNLVCPAGYDLGEDLRIVLLSVTEGEDKPLKYPAMFSSADVVVITKMDLAVPCEFDRERACTNIRSMCSGAPIFELSAKSGIGLPEFVDFLIHAAHKRNVPGNLAQPIAL
jgi:hydrogenase nickel incorporation protein HypB